MSLPDIRIQNTGEAQSNVPFTFGQVFKAGDLMQGEGLAGKLSDGSTIPLQVDFKASHGDRSVRHAIVSGVLPSLAKGATAKFDLVKAERVSDGFHAWPSADAKVTLIIDGAAYTAAMPQSWNDQAPWLLGNIVDEMSFDAPLVNKAGAAHPLLTVKFAARLYHATKAVRVEVIVENTKTWRSGDKFIYDVSFEVGGVVKYQKTALTHYHHSRWHAYAWQGKEPAIHIQHNTAYLIASKAVSNYEQLAVADDAVNIMASTINSDNIGPMTIGPAMAYMGTTGGRSDIGPLPAWTVLYLLSMDKRAKEVMMAAADGSGTWSIHYRDEKTGAPLRIDNDVNKNITTHWNGRDREPLPRPRLVNDAAGETPNSEDVAHQPSLTYLPYLLTGDSYYLEELHFWASSNPLKTEPAYRGFDKGLMRWEQVRGQAWSLRTLGHAAYITPDANPMKAYFAKQLDNNLDFYNQTYVVGNPNKLGVYDGSGEFSVQMDYYSPWQDDFLTWVFSYLTELGFAKADPIFKWKAKAVLGRMNGPGFSWINAASYTLNYHDKNGKVFDTWAQVFLVNFDGPGFVNENGVYYEEPGVKYVDLPSGSQAQADYLGRANDYPARWYVWKVGRMTGGPDQRQGFPSNMQPALAAAATSGLPGAKEAWATFAGRADQPDYRYSPEWDILPRDESVTVTPPVTVPVPPVVTPPAPAKKGKITVSSNVALKKMTKLLIQVFNPATRELIRSFDNVTANSKGGFVLEDAALVAKTPCAYVVIDAKGKALVINLATVV